MKKILLFTIISISSVFGGLIHPPDGSELSYIHVTLQWETVEGSSGYDLQLSLTNDFTSPLVNINTADLYYIDKEAIDWETNYFWRVKSESGEWINTFNFTTTESSVIFQNDDNPIQILESDPELFSDGITFFGSYYNNYSAAIDMNGNEVWNSGGINTHVFFSVDENNNFLGGKFLPQYNNSLIGCEFSLNNSIFWSEAINEAILANESFTQHEFIKLPNGNYMGFVPVIEKHPVPTYTNFSERDIPFSWENDCELYIEFNSNFDWKGEKIVEWDKNSSEIIWEWNVFDYFNINDFDYLAGHWETACNSAASYDWIHFNALVFSETENALYVSSRHLDRITKIDYNSKDIIWNLGIQWLGDEIISPDTLFSGQHGLQLLPNGNIVTFDNGILSQYTTVGITSPISRAIEIAISDNNSQYSATTVWSHTLPNDLYGALSGNAQKLENGNYLINTIGNISGAYSVEVTENHEIAWMCKYNLGNYQTGPLYRAMRIPDIKIIVGCKDISACNYNIDANTDNGTCTYLDCAEVCGGTAVVDECDVCGGGGFADGACDCDGNVKDECGVCGGDSTSCAVYVEATITTTVNESVLEDLSILEENFESLIKIQLGLPDGIVNVNNITESINGVDIIIEFTITLTEEELVETEFDSTEDISNAWNEVKEEIADEGLVFINGCTDPNVSNYNPNANVDDGSCALTIYNGIIPQSFTLKSYPNPFNPVVNINIEIANLGYISGKIFNLNGQLIETLFSEYKSIGSYNLIWNASLYPSGIYLFILENDSELLMKKMIFLK